MTEFPDFARIGTRWPDYLVREFKAMRPVAVWVAGSLDMVSVTVHRPDGTKLQRGTSNRPCRAVKFGISTYFSDEVSARINQCPYARQQMLCRIWTRNHDAGKELMLAMVRRFTDISEPTQLEKDFIDVGPDYDLADLGADFAAEASQNVIEFWSDRALVGHLMGLAKARAEDEARRAGIGTGRGRDPVRRVS